MVKFNVIRLDSRIKKNEFCHIYVVVFNGYGYWNGVVISANDKSILF